MPFTVGQAYKRTWLHLTYGGSRQSGISPSRSNPIIFIFKSVRGEQVYLDRVAPDGTILYSGAGQQGDMTMAGANRRLAEHRSDGRALHVFEEDQQRRGWYAYQGEYICTGHFFEDRDRQGRARRVIIFRLAPAATHAPEVQPYEPVSEPISLAEMRARAEAAAREAPTGTLRAATYWERSKWVRLYALAWANNICQGCRLPAPFVDRNGRPFLEVHHVNGLAEGGADSPRHVIAICPNCHRQVHYGADGEDLNGRLRAILENRAGRDDEPTRQG